METITTKLETLNETKDAIKTAIERRGVPISASDSFKSYADRIDLIQGNTEGGVRILRAFVPSDFKGSTALNSTILLNPASYYHKAQEEFSIRNASLGGIVPFKITASTNMICVASSDSNNYGKEISICRDEFGEFNKISPLSGWHYWYYSYNVLLPETIIKCDNYYARTLLFKYDPTTNASYRLDMVQPVANRSSDSYIYKGIAYCVILKRGDYLYQAVLDSYYNTRTACFMKYNFVTNTQTNICMGNYNTIIEASYCNYVIYYKNGFIYLLNSGGNILRSPENEGLKIVQYKWDDRPETLTSCLFSTQFYDGTVFFCLDQNHNLHVFKVRDLENGDVTWIEDTVATNQISTLVQDIKSSTVFNISIQLDKSVYIQKDKLLIGFQYDTETGLFTQVSHPCNSLIKDADLGVQNCFVNLCDGVCALVAKISNTEYELRYAKLEKTDLGDLHWVAYEPVKANYTPKSITTQSLNITGTDEKGNNYVDVKALLTSNDLGDYLKLDNGKEI